MNYAFKSSGFLLNILSSFAVVWDGEDKYKFVSVIDTWIVYANPLIYELCPQILSFFL